MNHLATLFLSPFLDFIFMRHALVACLALALGCGPLGVFLVLRRMSLVGDALTHAVLPGVALGFLISGLSLYAMTLGGFATGLAVALLAGAVTRPHDNTGGCQLRSFLFDFPGGRRPHHLRARHQHRPYPRTVR